MALQHPFGRRCATWGRGGSGSYLKPRSQLHLDLLAGRCSAGCRLVGYSSHGHTRVVPPVHRGAKMSSGRSLAPLPLRESRARSAIKARFGLR